MDTIKAAWAKAQEAWEQARTWWNWAWTYVDAYPRTAFVAVIALFAVVRWFL